MPHSRRVSKANKSMADLPGRVQEIIYIPEDCFPPQVRIYFDSILVESGENFLTEVDYNRLKSHPDFERYVKRGSIVIGRTPEEMSPILLAQWDLEEWDKAFQERTNRKSP